MKLSEITPIQVLGGVLVVNTVLAGGTTQLTDLFGATMANHILSVCILGSGICGGFIMNMGGLPSQFRNVRAMDGVQQILVNGQASTDIATMAINPSDNKVAAAPGAVDRVTAIAAKVLILILAFALSAFLAVPSAMAQTKPSLKLNLPIDPLGLNGTPLTGNPAKDAQAVWDKIVAASDKDLQYASLMAANANTNGSAIRKACWDAILKANQQANGSGLKNADGTAAVKPDPHLFADLEGLAETVDNLSPQGALYTSCAGAAQLAKTNVLAFINAAVAGAAGLAAMPVVPGL